MKCDPPLPSALLLRQCASEPEKLLPRYNASMKPQHARAKRPQAGEYASYYEKYVSLINSDDIVATLEAQRLQTGQLLAGRSEREGNFRYAADKWSVKEVLGHMADTERVFAYRALRIGRGDQTPMASFEQDDYVRTGGFDERTLADLAEEFDSIRLSTLTLLRNFDETAWSNRGVASKNEVTTQALAYIIAGHEVHHRRILEERYFPAIPRA